MSETESEGEIKIVAKVVEVKLIELNLKPGAKLAMLCPEGWTPMQIGRFSEYMNAVFAVRGYEFDFLCFPFGTELLSITPSGGFE